MLSGIFM